MSSVEIAWMMLIEDNLAEIAAWANKQGDCVVIDNEDDLQKYPETVYIVSAASIYNDDIEEIVC